ncbi:signal transduction histidine kinase [Actinoplanes octamycinicus]|uniref:histidine kinase n=1 Tax=Actinoplanes octamycinicus TaxID=135948 RepID=A0A7W7H6F4_9ACTN|nr:histidine kinase [Actinoplanes octamycinicus]MBB4744517.1 signal transduction histidine kinase [Actinoplanes octamycinicus]GIE61564.1 two-component sensor histidine kinase [Actinoplanes octamycinicus]
MLRPLISAATYRRAVFLLLGAVLALPYTLGTGLIVRAVLDAPGSRFGNVLVALAAAVIALIPPFLGGTRELEIAAARSLLDVDLPGHDRGHRMERDTRLRAALWFGLHLLTGVAIGAVLLVVVPVGVLALVGGESLTPGNGGWWWLLAAPLILAGAIYAIAGLGSLAATMAPVLLGPSQRERERLLAERNRLARELHDSVGHALTAMTLQAGAARAVFDSDPAFALRALAAIEETGRSAAGELDAVLGILRDEAADHHATPTLADLDRLLTDQVEADLAEVDVSPRVSREAYRIVQESLTNAARHGAGPVTLRIRQEEDLLIEVSNRRVAAPRRRAGGGHGIEGMRERVQLLGGSLRAGPDGDDWRLVARLPR